MESTQTKTWTEIKLRNPDARLCQELSDIMADLGEKSATKAIEYLIHNYAGNKQKMQDQRDQLQKSQTKIREQEAKTGNAEFKLLQIKNSFLQFTKLLGEVPGLPQDPEPDNEDYNFDFDPEGYYDDNDE